MSKKNNKNEVYIYAHNEFHNNDHVVAHLANYMDRGQNPSNDLIHLTQKEDDSLTSTASPNFKQGTRYQLQKKQATHSNLEESPTLMPCLATATSTPVKTNDIAEKNNESNNSFTAISSVITPQPKVTGIDKGLFDSATQKNTASSIHNLASTKYCHSPYLKKEFKSTLNSFELSPELKSLQLLIMSQHEAFSTLIKDLGNITLVLSKIIDKKKESYNLLKND